MASPIWKLTVNLNSIVRFPWPPNCDRSNYLKLHTAGRAKERKRKYGGKGGLIAGRTTQGKHHRLLIDAERTLRFYKSARWPETALFSEVFSVTRTSFALKIYLNRFFFKQF